MTTRDDILAYCRALINAATSEADLRDGLERMLRLQPPPSDVDVDRPLEQLIVPGGPNSKYTPTTVAILRESLEVGLSVELACRRANLGRRVYYEWYNDEAKPEFRALMNRAQGDHAMRAMAQINLAANTQWQAAAWQLERRYPEEYGLRQYNEVQHEHSGNVKITAEGIDAGHKLLQDFKQRLLTDESRQPTIIDVIPTPAPMPASPADVDITDDLPLDEDDNSEDAPWRI